MRTMTKENLEAAFAGESQAHMKYLIFADQAEKDGFHKTAGLWTRLNCDLSYVQSEVDPSASRGNGFPDNPANTEPGNWEAEAQAWGFEGRLAGEMTAKTVPLAGVAEMADRVQADNWQPNLDSVLYHR